MRIVMRSKKCQISGCFATPSASSLACSAVHGFGRRKLVKIGCMVLCLCLAVFSLFWSPSSASALELELYDLDSSGSVSDEELLISAYAATYCDGNAVNDSKCLQQIYEALPQSTGGLDSNGVALGVVAALHTACYGPNAAQVQSTSVCELLNSINNNLSTATSNLSHIATLPDLVDYSNASLDNLYAQSAKINEKLTTIINNSSSDTTQLLNIYNQTAKLNEKTTLIVGNQETANGHLSNIYTQTAKLNEKTTLIVGNQETANGHLSDIYDQVIKLQPKVTSLVDQQFSAANQAHSDANAQIAATNAQTEQQKNQYEQDKQEEQDRENQGSEEANEAKGIFNFSIINPFSPLFALFSSPDTCASIPTLARWVHSDTSTVCSWWSADVRSILTPVFGISSIMLLFGFVIRWVGGSEVIDMEVVK